MGSRRTRRGSEGKAARAVQEAGLGAPEAVLEDSAVEAAGAAGSEAVAAGVPAAAGRDRADPAGRSSAIAAHPTRFTV